MCTVTWRHGDSGYELLCNRDEKRTRRPALGPAVKVNGGVRFVAPADGEAGGTWIGSNEFGITLCLLNGIASEHDREIGRSRGMLLPELLSALSAAEVGERVRQSELSSVASFTLAILQPGHAAMVVEWNGRRVALLPNAESKLPLVSSSVDLEGVKSERRHEFCRILGLAGKLDSSALYAYHASHGQQPDAYSPCMHRADAETVSFSWVKVTLSTIEFSYTPGAPCRSYPYETLTLPRLQ